MRKPRKQVHKFYNYLECEKYIAESLGTDSLDNFAGKTFDTGKSSDNLPWQDFWMFLIYRQDNSSRAIKIGSWLQETAEPWQAGIVQAFIEKFGDNQEYWTDW
jgi:hypothetical protein